MRLKDNPEIFVKDKNLDRAIKSLKLRSGAYGTRVILKLRRENPGRGAWKKAKAKKALKRLMRKMEKGKL